MPVGQMEWVSSEGHMSGPFLTNPQSTKQQIMIITLAQEKINLSPFPISQRFEEMRQIILCL